MKSRLSRLNPNRKIAGAVLLIILIVLGLLMACLLYTSDAADEL